MESCGMSVIKYILFVFNLIFALSGVGIIVTGAVVLGNLGGFSHFLEGRILAPPIVLIVAGSIVFLVAFLGCCGAIKENYFMLMTFAGLLLVIFIVELAVGIAAGVAKDDFHNALTTQLRNSMRNYTVDRSDQLAWDNVQRELRCCGVINWRDWQGILPAQQELPYTCCLRYAQPAGQTGPGFSPPASLGSGNAPCTGHTNPNIVFQEGCYEKMKMLIKEGGVVIMGVGIGIAFIEVAGIVLACLLASSIKKREDSMK